MTTYTTALVSSNLFGDSKGTHFNDLENVVGTMNITINTSKPIKSIKVMHGGVVDGIEVKYYKSDGSSGTTTARHGTSSDCDDSSLKKTLVTIGDTESIVAISGKAGTSSWGIRVVQLNFAIYDSTTGHMRIAGPYGGDTGTSFRVTANGNFIALGGFAIDTDSSLAQLKQAGDKEGGLYGLVFDEVNYRTV